MEVWEERNCRNIMANKFKLTHGRIIQLQLRRSATGILKMLNKVDYK
jgi:hypothetical protein